MECQRIQSVLVVVGFLTIATASGFIQAGDTSLNTSITTTAATTTTTTSTPKYWIRQRPDDITVLYITVPIAAGMLLMVLIFFLWVFSSKSDESLGEHFEYDRLEDEPTPGSSSSPTYPIVDQIFDLPYTNPVEVNDDLPVV